MPGLESFVIYLVMACAVLGALAAIRDPDTGLGREFMEGLYSIGIIFVPVAGIMAAVPLLSVTIQHFLGPAFAAIGADPSVAATSVIAVDMGGYKLAQSLAANQEAWMMSTIVGYMAGATIIFTIPVGLAMLAKSDHKYMALGIMSGILSVPIGVAVSWAMLYFFQPMVREEISANAEPTYQVAPAWSAMLGNLVPLVIFVLAVALGLRFAPKTMIRGFMIFGRLMDAAIKIILVACIVEYFTGIPSTVLSALGFTWQLDPIIADQEDQFRALEIAGYIGIMLAGAFPMVYILQKLASNKIEKFGAAIGLDGVGAAGLLATIANVLAMFRLVGKMRPQDKVLNIAFAVCAAFLLGDHLAFTANFQPTLIMPIMVGKIVGGFCGLALAYWLSVPLALSLEQEAVDV